MFPNTWFWGPYLTSEAFSKRWLMACNGAGSVPGVEMKTVNVSQAVLKELTV